MDPSSRQAALLQALTTEHFVLQTAAASTISEAEARSTLYVMSLSSSLIAMGFLSEREVFVPFAATVLPAVFLLGLFTVVRLVDTALENMQYLAGIARIREYYRTLGPEAASLFSAQAGRWPESMPPSLGLGRVMAFFGTSASMIAVINNVVAGSAVALIAQAWMKIEPRWSGIAAGAGTTVVLTLAFLAYQRWRFSAFEAGDRAAKKSPELARG